MSTEYFWHNSSNIFDRLGRTPNRPTAPSRCRAPELLLQAMAKRVRSDNPILAAHDFFLGVVAQ